jgi:predicted AlkP superfamily phosphohydrolase/phosphomutase
MTRTNEASVPVRRTGRGAAIGLAAAALLLSALPAPAKQMVVFGFDGLDPVIVQRMMDEGRLPNIASMAKTGQFQPLGTSIPPQSPVAWSNFITGMDAGGHGIFDFLHRDPDTMIPYLSTSRPTEVGDPTPVPFTGLQIPGSPKENEHSRSGYDLLRYGTPFWKTLEDNGIPCMIVRMPANFPVTGDATWEISGMSTPDVRGTYGTFSYWTNDPEERGMKVGGGNVYGVRVRRDQVTARFEGPPDGFVNPEKTDRGRPPRTKREFTVSIDPDEPYALIDIDGQQVLLKEGEWSGWVPFSLEMAPCNIPFLGEKHLQSIPVQALFYLKQVRPYFKLYASPMNFDPMNPAIPLEYPKGFAKEIAEGAGRFYTQGFPEDTKALDEGVLTIDEFMQQSHIAGRELIEQFPWVLDKFRRECPETGFLFYYTGNLDQTMHMMYQLSDPRHPQYTPELGAKYGEVAESIIEELDVMVGETLAKLGDDVNVVIMSDHGFASWRRGMHLNTWLKQEGYLVLKDDSRGNEYLLNTDWTRTRAYGLGINGIYVNLRGREKRGIVDPADRRSLLEEIAYKLVKVKDPETGQYAVTKAYISQDAYNDHDHLEVGPDMIVGYAKTYRCSNQSAVGECPDELFFDNMDRWAADHCMDHKAVPGTLVARYPLAKAAPNLQSLASAILAEFGIGGFPGSAESLEAVGYISAPATN